LTLDQKVGQMMMVGIAGPSLDESAKAGIETDHFGNVAFLGRNMTSLAQTRALANELQEAALEFNDGIGMLVAADLEGGAVWRVPPEVPAFPSALAVARTGSSQIAMEAGAAVGNLALAMGLNMDLAPVLDVNDSPGNLVIGDRSYGSEPEFVAAFGEGFLRGLMDAGVIPTGKHFPGHGSTVSDPHVELPVVDHDADRIQAVELVPFRRAIEAGLPAVMTAHVYYPALSGPAPVPATLSQEIVTGLLRDSLGFDGVVISDDFSMGAITGKFDVVDAAIRAVNAGVDIILVAGPVDATETELLDMQMAIHDGIVQAVRDGQVTEETVDSAVARILALKRAFGVGRAGEEGDMDSAIRELERVSLLIDEAELAR
jgi:beta-N-acetylhexosaminidase